MNFYTLLVEQFDDFKFTVGFYFHENEIQDFYKVYRKDLYKSVSIRTISLSIEEVLEVLIATNKDAQLLLRDSMRKGV
jgi:hypothetical protein